MAWYVATDQVHLRNGHLRQLTRIRWWTGRIRKDGRAEFADDVSQAYGFPTHDMALGAASMHQDLIDYRVIRRRGNITIIPGAEVTHDGAL